MGSRGPKPRDNFTKFGNLLFDLDYFHSRLKQEDNGCITWQGATHRQGYGMVSHRRQSDDQRLMTVTHRVAMMEHLGRELGRSEYVIHNCENKLCCNPDHLVVSDAKERTARIIRNPNRKPPGKYMRPFKYTEDEVRWIRANSTLAIAARYNIPRTRAGSIKSSLTTGYKWVK